MNKNIRTASTSWEKAKDWYDSLVGTEGQHYHREIIIPNLLKYWKLASYENPKVLDLACGQGVLARYLPAKIIYTGVDISPSLIKIAHKLDTQSHKFLVGDITQLLNKIGTDFTHSALILALQNLDKPEQALKHAAHYLKDKGILSLVINHPTFRIPRQSSWGVDQNKKLQYRRIDAYMSAMKIPIQVHPGKKDATETLSYHWPLSQLSTWLEAAGLTIIKIEEWCGDKISIGSKAKMENKARAEFPLFMAIHCSKLFPKK